MAIPDTIQPVGLAATLTLTPDTVIIVQVPGVGVRKMTWAALLAQLPAPGAFLGGVAGNAVPANSPNNADNYVITSAGTSQGYNWAVGDTAKWSAAQQAWVRIPANGLTVVKFTLTGLTGGGGNNLDGQLTAGLAGSLVAAVVAGVVQWYLVVAGAGPTNLNSNPVIVAGADTAVTNLVFQSVS